MQDFVDSDRPTLAVETDGFDGGVEPYSVAEFEAVGQCLFRAVDANRDSVEFVGFHTCCEGLSAEPIGADRWLTEPWPMDARWQRNMNLVRNLGREFMERQRGDQADDAVRNT